MRNFGADMELKIEYLSTAELIPYINNSRTHSDEQVQQVASSIKEFGFTNPILIDEDKGIIAGHGRLQAAQLLNLDNIPTITLEGLTEAQRKAYVIADNQLALNSGWDLEKLKVELERLNEVEFNLDLLGFDDDFLKDLLIPEPEAGLGDEESVPELEDNPVTALGDVWVLGEHRLMCGDSTDIGAIETLCEGVEADMLLTDPPYNVAYEGKTKDKLTIQNDQKTDNDFRQFLRDAFVACDTSMKQGAVFYIWHADSEGYNFRGAVKDANWSVRQCLIWVKQTMVMGRQDYHWKHEPCLYGWKDGSGHLWASDRKQTTVLEFDRPSRSKEHPTMKPVALFEYQMLNNTKAGDIVLDVFGGSGTTLIAAEKNRRYSRLMELDPKYCDVIIKRWQDYTGKDATLHGMTFDEMSKKRQTD